MHVCVSKYVGMYVRACVCQSMIVNTSETIRERN